MEKESIPVHQYIGEIIYKTSEVHFLAAQIISYYYLGNDSPHRISFIHDILTNEQSNLSFITNSLKRVLVNLGFDKNAYVEKNIESSMRSIGNLRNTFAHEVLIYNRDIHWIPDRKKMPWLGEGLNIKNEFDKFDALYNKIISEFRKIVKDKNIKIIGNIPDGYRPPRETP